jgi:hypothetical protein
MLRIKIELKWRLRVVGYKLYAVYMSMFKPVDQSTVQEHLDAVPAERKEAMNALHELILQTVPELPYTLLIT